MVSIWFLKNPQLSKPFVNYYIFLNFKFFYVSFDINFFDFIFSQFTNSTKIHFVCLFYITFIFIFSATISLFKDFNRYFCNLFGQFCFFFSSQSTYIVLYKTLITVFTVKILPFSLCFEKRHLTNFSLL